MRRFMAFIHHCVLGAYPRSLQELYGIRYFPVIQRGGLYGRLHMHILVCGGERLLKARWEPWAAWWRKNYGAAIDIKNDIHDQNGVRDYVLNYMLRGDEFSPEPIRSTWGDEEERRRSREAPLFEKRKQGIEVVPSHEGWTRYRSFLSKHYDPPQRSTRYPLETSNGKYSAELPSAPHLQPGAEGSEATLESEKQSESTRAVCEWSRTAVQFPFDVSCLSRRERRRARGHSLNGLHLFVSRRSEQTATAD
jgi:hypothetical protein